MLSDRFKQVLFAIGMTSALSCGGVTLRALQAENPRAETLEVPCRPAIIPNDVTLMAVESSPGHIVTDEQSDELMAFAPVAKAFIEFKEDAPLVNVTIMALDYGLSCPNFIVSPQDSVEVVTENQGRDRLFVGQQAQASTKGANTPSKPPRQVRICAKPLGNNVDNWFGTEQFKGTSTTANAGKYENEKIKATIVFLYDASAPPESVWNLGPNTKVRCPGKAPMPFAQYMASINGVGSQNGGSSGASTAATTTGTTSTTATPTTTTTTPKTGSGPPSATSSPNGQGPALSVFEQIANNMIVAGALAQGNTSAPLNQAGGHRNGMPGGTNVGGWSFPPLQAGVAAVQIISAIGLKPKDLVKAISEATKKGQRVIIKEVDKEALKMVDELIANTSQAELAHGFQQAGTIMPYAMGQKVTAKLEQSFQAHKIFEKRALELLKKGNEVSKAPSIVLTDAEHKQITKALNDAWTRIKPTDKAGLRRVYEEVYRQKYPHWLDAIDSYLR